MIRVSFHQTDQSLNFTGCGGLGFFDFLLSLFRFFSFPLTFAGLDIQFI